MFAIDIFWDRRRIFLTSWVLLSISPNAFFSEFSPAGNEHSFFIKEHIFKRKEKKRLLILKINSLIQYIWPSSLYPALPHLSSITAPSHPTVPFSFSEKSRSPREDIKTRYNKTRQRFSYWGWWDNPIGGKRGPWSVNEPIQGGPRKWMRHVYSLFDNTCCEDLNLFTFDPHREEHFPTFRSGLTIW